ncbi:MAG: homocysteine S-methyltransferase family protein [Huintestinicola sp.]|uniref:homocysteine S-methyltransferase family protein n=1 Tax=Huintestinicola sp. TaxID=2981661 RepID=UPI003EFF3DF2
MDLKKLLSEREFVFLDGAMGTMLQKSGLKTGETPELLNITHPEIIENIHSMYIEAGSDIVYANTFGANRYKLEGSGHTVKELIGAGIACAKNACKKSGREAYAALDIGPIGQLLEPTGSLSFEEAYDIFKEEVLAAEEADLIVIETMTDLLEVKAALLAAKENSDKPVICTMTFEQNGRTFTGCSCSAMALTLEGLGADAIGVNCSLGPTELMPVVEEICRWTTLPVAVKPNAGLPDPNTNLYNVTPEEFAIAAAEFSDMGVKILGGCCGTSPEYIKALTEKLSGKHAVERAVDIPAAVCSYANTCVIDQPRIIGERINPTGKKRFKEALKSGDIGYILGQAIEQAGAGADILDVNVGLPDIDEKAMMVRTVKALQGVTDLPLQIDSTIPEVIEAALRVYNGKAIVNSVNGEERSLETILPIVKKYGAAVVGLALDENGIPKTADKRFAIAEKIMHRAMEMGIPKQDIFIDCLTLTASAEQEGVMETVNALYRVKQELGLKTVLGVSNISFGLPNRELINSNFLQICLSHGLDLPIINPNIPAMTGAVRAYKLLTNIDKNAAEFIAAYNNATPPPAPKGSGELNVSPEGLLFAVQNGLKQDGAAITEKLLETTDPMVIVDDMLIPALDRTGADFESGKIFLPQLILSAGVAQAAFEVIKSKISKEGSSVSKGKVVLATVKGDIHDIGKNIVKVLLENYGYEVIDLGRDVEYQAVADAAMPDDVKLVGLSALMTTTLKSMEETIALLRKVKPDIKIVVGGAVLTPEYAEKIGADFYAKDAKATVDAARQIYGG